MTSNEITQHRADLSAWVADHAAHNTNVMVIDLGEFVQFRNGNRTRHVSKLAAILAAEGWESMLQRLLAEVTDLDA